MEHLACGILELKFDSAASEAMTFSGYGAVFGNVDAQGDVISPGAFADTLAAARRTGIWPAMMSQHGGWGVTSEDLTPVGVWTDLAEDGNGLKVAGKLAATPRGQELYQLMKMEPRPAINGLSIGYIAKDWTPRSKPDEPRRTLKRIDLIEISPVTFPANLKARVQSVKGAGMTEREFERWLMQDAGFSRSQARMIMSEGFKALIATQDAGMSDAVAELLASSQRNLSNQLSKGQS